MSLYNDLTTVLTPYANKIKQNESDIGDIQDTLEHLDVDIDKTLSIEGKPADAKVVGDAIDDLEKTVASDISYIKTSGRIFTDEVKTALFALLDKVAYTSDDADDYITALENALSPVAQLMSINAVFTQGSAVITDHDTLESLRQYLTVTGHYVSDDEAFDDIIANYTLSGTLSVGTSIVTVTVGNLTDTFAVTVTEWEPYAQYSKLIVTGAEYIATGLSEVDLDSCSFEYKVKPQTTSGSSGHILSTTNNFVAFPQISSNSRRYFAKINGSATYSSSDAWVSDTDITVVAYADANKSVIANGVTVITSTTVGEAVPSENSKYAMFGYGGSLNSAYYRFVGVFYYLKIYNSNNILIHHFVPAYDNTNHVAGVYDLVTETFKSSATSTDFTVE